MASRIVELFGYAPTDKSPQAEQAREACHCPFLGEECTKRIGSQENRISAGVCSLSDANGEPVICCPIRLYAHDYRILHEVAKEAFGQPVELYSGQEARTAVCPPGVARVAVFGKRWGKELRIPNRKKEGEDGGGRTGSYFVDWILAKLNPAGQLEEFVALEVQSIDTIGSYREERAAHMAGLPFDGKSAGLNWENVNKRIIPQLIYKGHLLQREKLCRTGLYFICPKPVYSKIMERLGGKLPNYPSQAGSLTFMWYQIAPDAGPGQIRELQNTGKFSTTVHQVELAFSSASNLPEIGVYEMAIKSALGENTPSASPQDALF